MGNQNDIVSCKHQPKQPTSILSKFLHTKRNITTNTNSKSTTNDSFIIKRIQQNRDIDNDTVQSTLDQRRVVFVSLIGLYTSWKKVPPTILYTALLLIPLKKCWIYEPSKYINELKTSFLNEVTAFGDINETKQFLDLLKWKDSQGLVMWILDYFDEFNNPLVADLSNVNTFKNPLVAKFWFSLNDKLTSLYDHITGTNYLPLHLNEKWWKNKDRFVSKYGTKAAGILSEYYFVTMKYNTISEIIYQSNPKSLHPIIVYRNRSNTKCFSPIKVDNKRIRGGFRVKKMCIQSPLSPIKEKKNDVQTNLTALDDYNPYLQAIQETNESINSPSSNSSS